MILPERARRLIMPGKVNPAMRESLMQAARG